MKPASINSCKPRFKEKDFQKQVITYAQMQGWRVAHFRPGMDRRGNWQTAVAGDGVGFPDLIMVRDREIVVAELKMKGNTTSVDQEIWLDAFKQTDAKVFVWYPDDWDHVIKVLQRR